MANQSTLRPAAPTLASLLQQYLHVLRGAPKFLVIVAAAVFCGAGARVWQKRRKERKAEENAGRTLVRRNSEVKLNDGG